MAAEAYGRFGILFRGFLESRGHCNDLIISIPSRNKVWIARPADAAGSAPAAPAAVAASFDDMPEPWTVPGVPPPAELPMPPLLYEGRPPTPRDKLSAVRYGSCIVYFGGWCTAVASDRHNREFFRGIARGGWGGCELGLQRPYHHLPFPLRRLLLQPSSTLTRRRRFPRAGQPKSMSSTCAG